MNGLQQEGIAATVKHFTCNDQENDRLGNDSVVSPRAFREIYLMPFMVRLLLVSLLVKWCSSRISIRMSRLLNVMQSRGPT